MARSADDDAETILRDADAAMYQAKSAGRGTVYAFTVTYRTQARGFRDELPYVLAYVELEEGVQVLTNLVGGEPATLRIGMPVRVTFEDVSADVSIPRFTPA